MAYVKRVHFAFEKFGDKMSVEQMAIFQEVIRRDGYSWKSYRDTNDVPFDAIPVGSVNFCEAVYGHSFKPDYYPDFLKPLISRHICFDHHPYPNNFIKPAYKYKDWDGFIYDPRFQYFKIKGPYWNSDVVKFTSEFRYYVADGKVLFGEYYLGEEMDTPEFPHDITIPSDYCGAIDLGYLENDKLELVEANHPYAIGWYGSMRNSAIYFDFILKGYYYIRNIIRKGEFLWD